LRLSWGSVLSCCSVTFVEISLCLRLDDGRLGVDGHVLRRAHGEQEVLALRLSDETTTFLVSAPKPWRSP
jgi:hypothetical protein